MKKTSFSLALFAVITTFQPGTCEVTANSEAQVNNNFSKTFTDLAAKVNEHPLMIRKHDLLNFEQKFPIERDLEILEALDPRCLTPNCIVSLNVICDESGIPVIAKDYTKGATEIDEFYCNQAIWEVVKPLRRGIVREATYTFTGGTSQDFGEHSELLKPADAKYVTLHLIPQSFPASYLIVPLGKISAKQNVLKLSVKKLNDPRLNAFRKEWYSPSFWAAAQDFKTIEERAAVIKAKYADFFE